MMTLAFLATAAAAHLDVLKLSIEQTAFLGLILGEISKALNTPNETPNIVTNQNA